MKEMEENRPATANGRSGDLRRPYSDVSSLTHQNLKDLNDVDSKESLHLNVNPSLGKCSSRWTDEKHNLYIHHLEASFVKHLHQSMLGRVPHPAYQLTVLRDDCWKKNTCERSHPLLDTASSDSSKSILKDPWVQHFTSAAAGKKSTLIQQELGKLGGKKRTINETVGENSEQIRVTDIRQQDSTCAFTVPAEVSDQNFVEEEDKDRSSNLLTAKRLKTDATDTSSQDQIVPSTNFRTR